MIGDGNSMRRVLGLRSLSDKAYVLRMERGDMIFAPGQHITLGLHGDTDLREYSLYSAPGEPFLEVLITETDPGLVSRKLRRLAPGDGVEVNGPYGFFVLPEDHTARVLAVATGTGIAPFHSMCGAFPARDILVLHGIREMSEAYDRADYGQYVACTSQSKDGDFHGRVTAFLADSELSGDTYVYLCGNCEMIYAVYDLLQAKGHPAEQIKTEVYF